MPRTSDIQPSSNFNSLTTKTLTVSGSAYIYNLLVSTFSIIAGLIVPSLTTQTIVGNPGLAITSSTPVTIGGDDIVTLAAGQTLTNKVFEITDNTLTYLGAAVINQDVQTTAGPTFTSMTAFSGGLTSTTITPLQVACPTVFCTNIYDTAGGDTALINSVNPATTASDLSTHVASVVAHGTTSTIVGVNDSQVLTTKTIDSASNTVRVSGININSLINQDVRTTASPTFVAVNGVNPLTTASSLSSHISATTAHGTTSAVVGINDNQTLTTKTINSASNTLQVGGININLLINQDVRTTASPTFNLVNGVNPATTASSLSAHTLATAAHGTATAIVGINDNQTLTMKTIDSANNTLRVNGTNINSLINQDVRTMASPSFINPTCTTLGTTSYISQTLSAQLWLANGFNALINNKYYFQTNVLGGGTNVAWSYGSTAGTVYNVDVWAIASNAAPADGMGDYHYTYVAKNNAGALAISNLYSDKKEVGGAGFGGKLTPLVAANVTTIELRFSNAAAYTIRASGYVTLLANAF